MQPREKILAGFVGALVVVIGLYYGYSTIAGWYEAREDQLAALEKQISDRKLAIRRGDKARRMLSQLEARSLPADLEMAQVFYQQWLTELVGQAKLAQPLVEPGKSIPISQARAGKRETLYEILPFTLRARGNLDALTNFLYAFYRSPHLHQVTRIVAKPTENASQLDLLLRIEAVVLPTADRSDSLSQVTFERLADLDAKPYRQAIVERNLFAPYTPPPPPRRPDPPPIARRPDPPPTPAPKPPSFDTAKYAFVTAILETGGVPEVWIVVRTTGQVLKLGEGAAVQLGDFKARIAKIEAERITIEFEGQSHSVALGEHLRMGLGEL